MILPWMGYATLAALFFGVAAASLERVVRARGRPVRGLWIGGLLASVVGPALGLLVDRAVQPEAPEPLTLAPISAWVDASTLYAVETFERSSVDLGLWIGSAWAASSALLLLAVVFFQLATHRRSLGWRERNLEGHRIWMSRDVGPAVVGLWFSRIVIPEWLMESSEQERALVIAHEAEHLRARDPSLLAVALVLPIAMPWNLALWWQWLRLRQAVEVDCDRRVLRRGVDARLYGRLLVDMTERGSRRHLTVAALAESQSSLERRIRLMTTLPGRWVLRGVAASCATALAVLGACQLDRSMGPGELTGAVQQAPTSTDGPSGVISGRVVRPDGAPVVGVQVSVEGTTRGGMTGDDGRFAITGIPSGPQILRASRTGYAERRQQAEIAADVSTDVVLTLSPQGPADAAANSVAASNAYQIKDLERNPELINGQDMIQVMERLYAGPQAAGAAGTVMVEFVIATDGTADQSTLKIIRAEDPRLNEASLEAVKTFRFRPGQIAGQAVRTLIQMPITWRPKAQASAGASPASNDAPASSEVRLYRAAELQSNPAIRNVAQIPDLMARLYPRILKEAGIGGTVVMMFVVEPDGTVNTTSDLIKVLSSPNEQLTQASAALVQRLRFSPGQVNNRPVRALLEMPITWAPGAGE